MFIITYRISNLNPEEEKGKNRDGKIGNEERKTHVEAGRMVEDMKTLEDL